MREKVKDKGRLEHIHTIEPIDLWQTIRNDIPVLRSQISHLLETVDFIEE